MKKILFAAFITSILGCEKQSSEDYYLRGEAKGFEDGRMIQVAELDENNQPKVIDSVAIENEEFSLDLPEVMQPNLSFLGIKGVPGNVMFISENATIKFEIYKDSLQASKVSGGEQNRVFYEYLNHIKEVNQKVIGIRTELQKEMASTGDSAEIARLQNKEQALRDSDMEFRKDMAKNHPDKFVSVLILTDLLNIGAPVQEVQSLYIKLSENIKKAPLAQNLEEVLEKEAAVAIGSKAPSFSGPDPNEKEVALEDVMGKVTLIDFWAAWCKPCRVENPNIVRIYKKYHDKGFNIVGVSLDRDDQKDRWLKAIEDDNLTWHQISHLQGWQEPIARLYGVQAIPAQFILDENGIIVAKNLRGDDLEEKVRELLNQ